MDAEIDATNKIIEMSEIGAKKMLFAIGDKGKLSWDELNKIADIFINFKMKEVKE